MRILISGSTGLVGSALIPFLQQKNHDIVRLVRRTPKAREIQWDRLRSPIVNTGPVPPMLRVQIFLAAIRLLEAIGMEPD